VTALADATVTVPNLALREHVTRVGFDLALGKTHVAALVTIDTELKYGQNADWRKLGKLWQSDIIARRGLVARGLIVTHRDLEYERRHKHWSAGNGRYVWDASWPHDVHPRERYTVTVAGRAVCVLLEEAGLYEEIAALVRGTLEPVVPIVKVRPGSERAGADLRRPPPDWPGYHHD
jgi:hypothetical protein